MRIADNAVFKIVVCFLIISTVPSLTLVPTTPTFHNNGAPPPPPPPHPPSPLPRRRHRPCRFPSPPQPLPPLSLALLFEALPELCNRPIILPVVVASSDTRLPSFPLLRHRPLPRRWSVLLPSPFSVLHLAPPLVFFVVVFVLAVHSSFPPVPFCPSFPRLVRPPLRSPS